MANYCVQCGINVDNEWNFCPSCGQELPKLVLKNSNEENIEKINHNEETKENIFPRKVDADVFTERLKEYRLAEANIKSLPAYCIFSNKALEALVEARKYIFVKEDILKIKQWGVAKVQQYGEDIIAILNYLDQNIIS